MGVDLNETFTVHVPCAPKYDTCSLNGTTAAWEVTRELSYLNGSVTGLCSQRFYSAGRVLIGSVTHPCAVLTQITLVSDGNGQPTCGGCRCCTTCSDGCSCLEP